MDPSFIISSALDHPNHNLNRADALLTEWADCCVAETQQPGTIHASSANSGAELHASDKDHQEEAGWKECWCGPRSRELSDWQALMDCIKQLNFCTAHVSAMALLCSS